MLQRSENRFYKVEARALYRLKIDFSLAAASLSALILYNVDILQFSNGASHGSRGRCIAHADTHFTRNMTATYTVTAFSFQSVSYCLLFNKRWKTDTSTLHPYACSASSVLRHNPLIISCVRLCHVPYRSSAIQGHTGLIVRIEIIRNEVRASQRMCYGTGINLKRQNFDDHQVLAQPSKTEEKAQQIEHPPEMVYRVCSMREARPECTRNSSANDQSVGRRTLRATLHIRSLYCIARLQRINGRIILRYYSPNESRSSFFGTWHI